MKYILYIYNIIKTNNVSSIIINNISHKYIFLICIYTYAHVFLRRKGSAPRNYSTLPLECESNSRRLMNRCTWLCSNENLFIAGTF